MVAPPLIVTLALNAEAEAFFNDLRQLHFPSERNFLAAHLTLFHQLPAHAFQLIQHLEIVSTQQETIHLNVSSVVYTGRGVAYKLESPVLQHLHKQLQQQWQPWLIPQDKQKLWPHVTVQNKVPPHVARTLHQLLENVFVPFDVHGTGFRLWHYLDGPWELVHTFPFLQSNTIT
jgi:hypothetical protein